jgi:hypothetical protein
MFLLAFDEMLDVVFAVVIDGFGLSTRKIGRKWYGNWNNIDRRGVPSS